MSLQGFHQAAPNQSQSKQVIKLSIFDIPQSTVAIALIDVVMNDTDLSVVFDHEDHYEQVNMLVKSAISYFNDKDNKCNCTVKTVTIVPYVKDLLERMKDRECEPEIKKKNDRLREMAHLFDALNAVKPVLVKIEEEFGETACFICEQHDLDKVTSSINLALAEARQND